MEKHLYKKKIVCSHCIHKEGLYYNCIKKLPIKNILIHKSKRKLFLTLPLKHNCIQEGRFKFAKRLFCIIYV